MTDIDWSKAPKWAVSCARLTGTGDLSTSYWICEFYYTTVTDSDGEVFLFGFESDSSINFSRNDFFIIENKPMFIDCTIKPSTPCDVGSPTDDKPVFTQKMADAGELPDVGMECMVIDNSLMNHVYEKCVILFFGIYKVVYSSDSCVERISNINEVKFKPLDTKTDQEKAIDDIKKVDQRVHADHNFSQSFLDAIKTGAIHGVKWVGNDRG